LVTYEVAVVHTLHCVTRSSAIAERPRCRVC